MIERVDVAARAAVGGNEADSKVPFNSRIMSVARTHARTQRLVLETDTICKLGREHGQFVYRRTKKKHGKNRHSLPEH